MGLQTDLVACADPAMAAVGDHDGRDPQESEGHQDSDQEPDVSLTWRPLGTCWIRQRSYLLSAGTPHWGCGDGAIGHSQVGATRSPAPGGLSVGSSRTWGSCCPSGPYSVDRAVACSPHATHVRDSPPHPSRRRSSRHLGAQRQRAYYGPSRRSPPARAGSPGLPGTSGRIGYIGPRVGPRGRPRRSSTSPERCVVDVDSRPDAVRPATRLPGARRPCPAVSGCPSRDLHHRTSTRVEAE